MVISSRTPDGLPNYCPICGKPVVVEPSTESLDATCPHCGCLMWFSKAHRSPKHEVKHHIRQLVDEIRSIPKYYSAPLDVAREFSTALITTMAAPGSILWAASQLKPPLPIYVANRGLLNTIPHTFNVAAIQHVRRTSEQLCLLPGEEFDTTDAAQNTTDHLHIFTPIINADESAPRAVLQIVQRATASPAAQRGYARFTRAMCAELGASFRFLYTDADPGAGDTQQ